VSQTALFDRPYTSNIAKFDQPRCTVCDSDRRRLLYKIREHEYTTSTDDEFPLMECEDCGAWYLDPRPDVSALDIIYPPNYYSYCLEERAEDIQHSNRKLLNRLGNYFIKKRLMPIAKFAEFSPETEWLDVGCGSGAGLETLREAYGMQATGLDMSESAVALCRARGFDAYTSRFEHFDPPEGKRFDVIYSSHVIEHVASPVEYMQKSYELLNPRGLCACVTPNTSTWEARRFGRYWGGLHAPRHWTMFNERSARRLGERTGFELVSATYSPNGTFWTWTFHSRLQGILPQWLNDAIFPSDQRFINSNLWNISRIGLFTYFDLFNLLVFKQTSNMLLVFRKVG